MSKTLRVVDFFGDPVLNPTNPADWAELMNDARRAMHSMKREIEMQNLKIALMSQRLGNLHLQTNFVELSARVAAIEDLIRELPENVRDVLQAPVDDSPPPSV